jgi:hypothetical protein
MSTLTSTVNDPVTVDLAPADIATCTYVDTRNVVDLTVLKQTTGGSGTNTFNFGMHGPTGTLPSLSADVSTPDDPVVACTVSSVCDTVDTGGSFPATYTITEALPPPTADGAWAVSGFECNGAGGPTTNPVQSVTITSLADATQACTFTDSFTPTGSLAITKTTTGGVGTTEFVVTPKVPPTNENDTGQTLLTATTTQPGVPAPATVTSGTPLDDLTVGQQYSITEEGPEDNAAGTWATQSISCNGTDSDPTSSDTVVTIAPHTICGFTNAFTATAPATTTTTVAPAVTTTLPSGNQGAAASAVTPAGTAPGLAMTGEDVRTPLLLAAVLALLGLSLIVVDRIRRRRQPVPISPDDDSRS